MGHGRTLVIANPAARHGETEKLIPSSSSCSPTSRTTCRSPTGMGHATELAAAAEGYDLVVAAGGDGTVHEVLNGLMRHPGATRPALGLLPTGSGNDTRRTLGVPTDLAQAALELATGERRRFDVGVCNGIYFNNSFAAGLDAKVTAKAVEYKVTNGRDRAVALPHGAAHVLFNDLDELLAADSLRRRRAAGSRRHAHHRGHERPDVRRRLQHHPRRASPTTGSSTCA